MRHEAAGFLCEINQDRTALENRHRLAAIGGSPIDDRRHPAVGTELEELRLVLVATAKLHGLDGVRQAAFLQHDRDFPAVRRWRVVQLDHGGAWGFFGFPVWARFRRSYLQMPL